jgi:hypothetical protein
MKTTFLLAVVVLSSFSPIPKDENPGKSGAYVISTNFVKDYINTPSTAKFDSWTATPNVEMKDNIYVVQYHFDSQNKYGTFMRHTYTCALMWNGHKWESKGNWLLVFLEIDNEVLVSKLK